MKHWPIKPLGELCDVEGGNPAPQGDEHFKGGTIPFVRMKDLGRPHFTTNLTEVDDKLTEASAAANRMKVFEPGCILFPRSGSVALNHRAILGVRACIVSHIGVLKNLRPEITAGFLYLYLTTFDMTALSKKTTGVDSIAFADVKRIPIPVPPLTEQERIVKLLNEADALRKLRAKAGRRMTAMLPALFYEMFGDVSTNPQGWPIKQLREVVAPGDKINYGVVQPGDDFQNGVPICRVGDFEDMAISKANLKRIDPAIEATYRRSRLVGDEVLLACVGATIGKVALADESLRGFNIVRAVARIRCGPSLDRLFLAWQLVTSAAQAGFGKASRTVAQATLNIRQIEEASVLIPPLPLQKEFAQRATEIREIEAEQTASRRRLDDLFQSTLHRAFNGEL